jgi:formylglycine-generating enzyme required for sulfatase activity
MVAITWYEAAWYCNWLSGKEGIPEEQWCYEPNDAGHYGPGMKVKDNFQELTGYRLPTKAEWEHACRAGADSSRYYGSTESLLRSYAWYQVNSVADPHNVALLKPNDFGLFDMHGNVWEWCCDTYRRSPANAENATADMPLTGGVDESQQRVICGGAFFLPASSIYSHTRGQLEPDFRLFDLGFRPCKTCFPLPP